MVFWLAFLFEWYDFGLLFFLFEFAKFYDSSFWVQLLWLMALTVYLCRCSEKATQWDPAYSFVYMWRLPFPFQPPRLFAPFGYLWCSFLLNQTINQCKLELGKEQQT
jgi:hypothetical protein